MIIICIIDSQSRSGKLLLAIEPEVTNDDDDLAYQCQPERSGSHGTSFQPILEIPSSHIWENAPGANSIWGCCPGDHYTNRANNLSKCKRCADVKS